MQRIQRLRSAMERAGLRALVVFGDEYRPGHSTYLTGYKPINLVEESPQTVFLVEDLPPVVMIGRLNVYAARDLIWMDDVRPHHQAAQIIPDVLKPLEGAAARVGLVGEHLMPFFLRDLLQTALPDGRFEIASQLLIELRQIKSPAEVELMQQAAALNDRVLQAMRSRCKVGMTEIQVAAEADCLGRRMGADLGSATVVISGPNTRYPAWRPGARKIEPGDFLMLDFNPVAEHYCNDGGITLLMPGADDAQAQALIQGHRIIKEVVAAIQPGAPALSIHDHFLNRLEPLGYADHFSPYARGQRGVGHGVGIDVVEPPHLSPWSDFNLEAGMTLAIKLDLHDLNGGGYRLEVVVEVTSSRVNPLNKLLLSEPDDFAVL
jgi:Xaa-Pro aminopeptidase